MTPIAKFHGICHIQRLGNDGQPDGFFGTGFLITPFWVLTAAHVVWGVKKENIEITFASGTARIEGGVIIHDAYYPPDPPYDELGNYKADMALIRLKDAVSELPLRFLEDVDWLANQYLRADKEFRFTSIGVTKLGKKISENLRVKNMPSELCKWYEIAQLDGAIQEGYSGGPCVIELNAQKDVGCLGMQVLGGLEKTIANTSVLLGSSLLIPWINSHLTQDEHLSFVPAKNPNTRPITPQPLLNNPADSELNIFDYRSQRLEVLGRDQEQEKLRQFLKHERNFLWLQLAGVAGQGKSRLALELLNEATQLGWRAGFIDASDIRDFFKQHGQNWQPDLPHLLILDYVVGQEDKLQSCFRTLCVRGGINGLENPVRILLLERQPWNQGGLSPEKKNTRIPSNFDKLKLLGINDSLADWFLMLSGDHDGKALKKCHYGSTPIELIKLKPDELEKIVREVAVHHARNLAKPEAVLPNSTLIKKRLDCIDKEGRPLYAYLLGIVLSDGAPIDILTADWLLDYFIERELKRRWSVVFQNDVLPLADSEHQAITLALLATVTGGISRREPPESLKESCSDATTVKQALVIVDGPIGYSIGGPGNWIPQLKPNLLGEWVVIRYLEQGFPLNVLVELAWLYEPQNTAEFFLRLSQDFPFHPMTLALVSNDFPLQSNSAMHALSVVAHAIVLTYLESGKGFLPTILKKALMYAGRGASLPDESFFAADLDGVELFVESGDFEIHDQAEWHEKHSHVPLIFALKYFQGIDVEKNIGLALKICKDAAERGNIHAILHLASIYFDGTDVTKDLKQTAYWFKKGAEHNHDRCMLALGEMYAEGMGVPKNIDFAMDWYQKAAEQGSTEAMYFLGSLYATGDLVAKNRALAVEWCKKAAEQEHTDAMFLLAALLDEGDGVDRDPKQAVKWYKIAASQDHVNATYNLGVLYAQGKNVARNMKDAIEYYKKAAAQGHTDAMCNLGHIYATGKDVMQDFNEAKKWYQKAAKHNHPKALCNLGHMYFVGEGMKKKPKRAAILYKRSAELGHADAAFNLGSMYFHGIGVTKNYTQAVVWYKVAAKQGHTLAMFNVGTMYANGRGVVKNMKQALERYMKAAEQGHIDAIFHVGAMFALGEGVVKDLNTATVWLDRAAKKGHSGAIALLRQLNKKK